MMKTIFMALITYIATSIDEIPILFMLYRKKGNLKKRKTITISYFIGTFILIVLGLSGAIGLGYIPKTWMIGFVGLVPLFMGIKILIKGEDEDKEKEKAFASANKYKTFWAQVLAITIGLGVDDLSVYIPLFTTLSGVEIVLMIAVFMISTATLCYLSYQLTRIDKLTEVIEKYERFIIGVIFAAIGILVMAECGTLSKMANMILHQQQNLVKLMKK